MALPALAILLAAPVPAAELDLSEGWKIKTGDDAAYSKPALDDGAWAPIEVGVNWEEAGLPDYDGYAWYRLRIVVPEDWRHLPELKDWGGLMLELGAIDDVDETFFNDTKIGSTGKFPPDYQAAWTESRKYFFPAELVNWGRENVIAVRVYDGQGGGGIYWGSVKLRTPMPGDSVGFDLKPYPKNAVVAAGKYMRARVRVQNLGPVALSGTLHCIWKGDRIENPPVFKSEAMPFTLKPGKRFSHSAEFGPAAPGFYHLNAEVTLPGAEPKRDFLVFGAGVESVKRPLTREPDFDEFWEARLADLADIDPEYSVEHVPDKSTAKVDAYLVGMNSYGGVRIFGWYTVPKRPGPHAAVLALPGYTSSMNPATDWENMAVLGLDIRAHGMSKESWMPKEQEFMYDGLNQELTGYFYAGAFMDCVRGIDFLASRPEVDPERIGVTGGSQGGGLSLVTAGLDPRIKACAPDVPWVNNWPDFWETAQWAQDDFPKLLARRPDLTPEKLMKILSYFDAMNLADRIQCPVFLSLGLRDDVCPPRMILGTYNRIVSPKKIIFYPFGDHGGGGDEHYRLEKKWLAKQLGAKL